MMKNSFIAKSLCSILAALMLFQGLPYNVFAAPAENGSNDIDRARFERLYNYLEKAEPKIPKDSFDLETIVRQAGKEPTRLFGWVRDETFYVPYKGSLRGADGVLMDRLGNSIDRALLLAALLKQAGHEARLAHGQLDRKTAQSVLDTVRRPPADGVKNLKKDGAAQSASASLDALSGLTENDAALKKYMEQQIESSQKMQKIAEERTRQQTAAILKALGREQPVNTVDMEKNLQAVQDHWWAQWKDGDKYIDLDPTLPTAQLGKAIATEVAETIAPDKLPNALRHSVGLRVIVELFEKGKVQEEPVLEQTLYPSDLIMKNVVLTVNPLHWSQEAICGNDMSRAALEKAILKHDEWLPVLSVGDKVAYHASFTLNGKINASPDLSGGGSPVAAASDMGGAMRGMMGGMFGALGGGGLGGGIAAEPEKKDRTVSAAWIEYTASMPGAAKEVHRRQIFDMIGPAARQDAQVLAAWQADKEELRERSFSLFGHQAKIIAQANWITPASLEHMAVRSMQAARPLIDRMLSKKELSCSEAQDMQSKNAVPPLPGLPESLAIGRYYGIENKGQFYIDRPNILTFHNRLGVSAEGNMVLQDQFDIVTNQVAVFPEYAANSFQHRLQQGVLDSVLESVLLTGGSDKGGGGGNASELMEGSLAAKEDWIVVREAEKLKSVLNKNIPQNVAAQMGKNIGNGYTLLISPRVTGRTAREVERTVAWWRINEATGDTLSVNVAGIGQAASEYWIVTANSIAAGALCAEAITKIYGKEYYHTLVFCSFLFLGGGYSGIAIYYEIKAPALWAILFGIISAIANVGM